MEMENNGRHLSRGDLELFYLGKLDEETSRLLVRHLLSGCRSCGELSKELWNEHFGTAPGPWDSAADFEKTFRRAADRAAETAARIEAERQLAPLLLLEL